jgi:antitoxin component of MazEF toxin-antitoxin module
VDSLQLGSRPSLVSFDELQLEDLFEDVDLELVDLLSLEVSLLTERSLLVELNRRRWLEGLDELPLEDLFEDVDLELVDLLSLEVSLLTERSLLVELNRRRLRDGLDELPLEDVSSLEGISLYERDRLRQFRRPLLTIFIFLLK